MKVAPRLPTFLRSARLSYQRDKKSSRVCCSCSCSCLCVRDLRVSLLMKVIESLNSDHGGMNGLRYSEREKKKKKLGFRERRRKGF